MPKAPRPLGAVEIELEDLVLGQVEFEPDREIGFLDLALQRALVRQEKVLRKLLAERGATLHDGVRWALTASARIVPGKSMPKCS